MTHYIDWDTAKLDKIIFRVEDKQFQNITSLILIQNEHVIIDKYFGDFQADMLHEAQSTTKSLVSMLVGIAIDKGFIPSIREKIKQYFPEYQNLDWSEGKEDITIQDLLTMRAGLVWNESEITYHSSNNDANRLFRSQDWLAYALSKKMQSHPNTEFNYSSANPILLSKIIGEASNMPQLSFVAKYLFQPLGITKYHFPSCPKNSNVLGDVYIQPYDLAKLGLLMLNYGKWQDKQIISEDWVVESTLEQVSLDRTGIGYAYCWWRRIFEVKQKRFFCYYAWGYGGQHIFIFPEQRLVMTTTAQIYDITLAPEPFQIVEKVLDCLLD